MITGYNTEIKHRGRLFHVQTEDKGMGNPIIESLIYIGGEILDSVRSSYKESVNAAGFSKASILKLMEAQHTQVLQTIKDGQYDPKPDASSGPVGEGLVTAEHTLDEVVLSLIADKNTAIGAATADMERMELELMHGVKPEIGKTLSIELCARTDQSGEPVAAAQVTIKLISKSEKPLPLFQGETDKDGIVSAKIKIPNRNFESGAIVIQASSPRGYDEIRRPLAS